MGVEKIFDNLNFKHIDAFRSSAELSLKNIPLLSITFGCIRN